MSGSQAARSKRKQLPLTEDDPNRSLIKAQQEEEARKNMQFIGGDDDSEEGVSVDEEGMPASMREAEELLGA